MNWQAVLLVVALILFLLDALGVSTPRVSLTALGLAFLTGAFLVPLV